MSPSKQRLIYASDSTAWSQCERRAWFLLHPPGVTPLEPDPFDKLIMQRGLEHEQNVLQRFKAAVSAESVEHTQALIEERVDVIYQPKFVNLKRGVYGAPDFLFLRGAEYQIVDVKLALSVDTNKAIKAQLGVYRWLTGSRLAPLVYLGDGSQVELSAEADEIAEEFLTDMWRLQKAKNIPEVHYGYSKCSGCAFYDVCLPMFEESDDLSLSPRIDVRSRAALHDQGVSTLSEVATMDPDQISDRPYLKGEQRKRDIVQQAKSLTDGVVIVREPLVLPTGSMVHFDVESDPLAEFGAVYCWGLLKPEGDASAFEAIWHDGDDYQAWRAFLELVASYREIYQPLILVHYSPYEMVQIRHYAERYDEFEDPMVSWLLDPDGPMWDLQKFVKRHLYLPVHSYGLKSICRDPALVDFQWRLTESGSQWSVVRYHDYLDAATREEAESIRREILLYNEDDVRATAALVEWLGPLTENSA